MRESGGSRGDIGEVDCFDNEMLTSSFDLRGRECDSIEPFLSAVVMLQNEIPALQNLRFSRILRTLSKGEASQNVPLSVRVLTG